MVTGNLQMHDLAAGGGLLFGLDRLRGLDAGPE